ncbi:anti-sigma factor [Cryobacterium sp. TmT2-59]|uniref:Regulator of SigK n=1 Tax=Cryobacterium shii TaxID=1259235 RepID=A0AAQ2HEQ9_9MICO|nr:MULTISPECIES: anti-sigma factor [Cryobacterium]TFC42789.1 anti-sigma factor [Cryobacterium shii]TFC89008.1 anti-sigma factor [Cryobacterium sp. TmT2-59]
MSENTRQNGVERGDNPGDLAGAYALNALGADDAAAYEGHLAESEQARIEAAELGDTAVALGLAAAPVQPTPGLKASLMAKLAATPQLPALAGPAAAVAPVAAPQAEPGATEAARPETLKPAQTRPETTKPETTDAPAPAPATVTPIGGAAAQRARSRWFQRPVGLLLAAAAAVALFVAGGFAGQAFNTNQFEQQQAAGLAQINAAPDSQRASTTTADGHPATLVWSSERHLSALLVDDLPSLPSDKDYQLWYIGGDGAVPAGTFDSSGAGTVWRVLDGSMTAGDTIGVTVEPRGGSRQPTTDPIVAIQSS